MTNTREVRTATDYSKRRDKRSKLTAMAHMGEGPEAEIAQRHLDRMSEEDAQFERKRRGYKGPKPTLDLATALVPVGPLKQALDLATALVPVGPLKQALDLATTAGDIKALRDVAAMGAALQQGAKARGMGIEAENQAAEVIIRAERAMGSILLSVPRSTTGPAKGTPRGSTSKASPTPFEEAVEAAGMSHNPKGVHLWQTLARMPDDLFEGLLAQKREEGSRLARIDLIREATPKPKFADPESRSIVLDAMRSEDPIPVVVKFEKAAVALMAHTDTLPEAELRLIAGKVQELVAWYNAQRERHA